MKMWIQIQGRDDDDEFPDDAEYDILDGGVLKVLSGSTVHLFSPTHWQHVLIDTGAEDQREEAVPPPEDIRWQ